MKNFKNMWFAGLAVISTIFPAIATAGSHVIENPIRFDTIADLIAEILDVIVLIAIPISILFIIYAGFLFVTARGNEEQLKKAKNALLWTVIGIAILLGASVLADIIANTITAVRT